MWYVLIRRSLRKSEITRCDPCRDAPKALFHEVFTVLKKEETSLYFVIFFLWGFGGFGSSGLQWRHQSSSFTVFHYKSIYIPSCRLYFFYTLAYTFRLGLFYLFAKRIPIKKETIYDSNKIVEVGLIEQMRTCTETGSLPSSKIFYIN